MLFGVNALVVMATTEDYFKGLIIYNDTSYHYTSSFNTKNSTASPYLKYDCVYTEGDYYVGTQYKNGNTYVSIESSKYYCSSIADGRVLSVKFMSGKDNRVFLKARYASLYVDIDYMRITY